MNEVPLPRLTDAEFEIMDIVWDEEETTINHVWETINLQRATPLSRTTIQVQMNRLEDKKWLQHRKQGRTFFYYPTRKRDQTLESIVEEVHGRFFKGSRTDLVQCLFRSQKISKSEIRKLKEIIKNHEGG